MNAGTAKTETVEALRGERIQPGPRRFGRWLRSAARFAQTSWSILGISLLLLLLVDRVAQTFFERGSFQYARQRLEQLQPESDSAWINQFVAERGDTEFTSTAVRWEPFVYWRSAEHRGQFFNVDANGLRRTVHSDAGHAETEHSAATTEISTQTASPSRGSHPWRIFMFGGSALWGDSVRDEHTLPSLLAQRLTQAGYAVDVSNYGQLGYVSTQEWIALALELRRGNVPDLVVFYDGANDVGAAAVNPRPGLTINETNRVAEFNLLNDASWGRLVKSCAYNTAIGRLVRGARGPEWAERQREQMQLRNDERIAQRSASLPEPPPLATAEERTQFERAVRDLEIGREAVAVYRANLRLVQALQQAAGFEALFYWQPTVLDRQQPSADEQAIIDASAKLHRLWKAAMQTWNDIRASEAQAAPANPWPETIMLGDVFDAPEVAGKSMFFDLVHPSEAANAIVAARMLPQLREALDRRAALRTSSDAPHTP
jgi:lysophospholipase L1-like esterase